MSTAYTIGKYVRVHYTIENAAGELVDPTAVAILVRKPKTAGHLTGELFTYIPTRESLGVYYYDILATAAGTWCYRWEASGNITDALEGKFDVAPHIARFEGDLSDPDSESPIPAGIDQTARDAAAVAQLAANAAETPAGAQSKADGAVTAHDASPAAHGLYTYDPYNFGTISATEPVSHLAIQAAMDAAAVNGGTVVLPPQKMLLGASLVPKSGVRIVGTKPKTFSNTSTPDGNFNLVGGTRLSFPGGVVFQQDTSASFALHQACGQFAISGVGFENCLSITVSGAQSKHGYWNSTFEEIVGDNITGTAFECGNPQHILLRSIQLNNPLRALHFYTNYRNAEVVNSPGNSQVIDFYASMSTVGGTVHDQPGLLIESKAGQDGFIGGLSFYRFQINRGNDGVKQGSNIELRGTSTAIVSANFEGLDIEGSANHAIEILNAYRCRFHINGVSGADHVNRTLYATGNCNLVVDSDDPNVSLEFGDDTSAVNTMATGKFSYTGGTNRHAVGLYNDLSDSGKFTMRWDVYDASKVTGSGFTTSWNGIMDLSSAQLKMGGIEYATSDTLWVAYTSRTVRCSATANQTMTMPAASGSPGETTTFIKQGASGVLTITGLATADVTVSNQWSTVQVRSVNTGGATWGWYVIARNGA